MESEKNEKLDPSRNEMAEIDGERQSSTTDPTDPEAQPEYEYITGAKLWLVLASVTLICFLMMLDMSIIVTVSSSSIIVLEWPIPHLSNVIRPSHKSPAIFMPCQMLAGMAVHIY
jgi:hypothetical protein